MNSSRFDTWKYTHPGPGYRPRWQRPLGYALLLASLLSFHLPPLSIFLFFVSLVAIFASQKKLFVCSRYLICGERIIYFGNVQRVDRDDVAGNLSLTEADQPPLIIERENFPTSARKAPKIKRNREAKFVKAAERIVVHVRAANPAADIRVHC